MGHRELWKRAFCDTEPYIDFYFKEKAKRCTVYSKYVNGELASMAFFSPRRVCYRGKECVCPYIVGVATREKYRHRGYMRMLLEQGMMDAAAKGVPLVFLSPADPNIYEPLGFQGVYIRNQLEVMEINRKKWYTVSGFSRLERDVKKRAVEFAAAQLYASEFDLYVCRDIDYYELLHRETEVLGGGVAVVRDGAYIRAVASYIHEEDFYEVTEVICDSQDGQKVVESLCAYFAGRGGDKVIFSDGYFLGDVKGSGIRIRRMDQPYLMVKYLGDRQNMTLHKVYVNDIT